MDTPVFSADISRLLTAEPGTEQVVQLSGDANDLVEDYEIIAPFEASITLHKTDETILARLKMGSFRYRVPCSLCLTPVERDSTIGQAMREYLIVPMGRKPQTPPDGDIEIVEVDRKHMYIDLSPFVRDEIYVAIPPAVHCTSDCKGLCAQCGKNLNEGPCEHVTV